MPTAQQIDSKVLLPVAQDSGGDSAGDRQCDATIWRLDADWTAGVLTLATRLWMRCSCAAVSCGGCRAWAEACIGYLRATGTRVRGHAVR